MAADLSALSNITTSATALSNLVLVSPQKTIGYQPQNPASADGTPSTAKPPPALLFHYEGEQSVTLESDITDHYIEDNTAVQDQIALKPETVVVHGFIGELNNVAPLGLQTLKAAADKLTAISAYTPALSTTALIAYNTAFQLYQVGANAINAAVSSWNALSGGGGENVIGSLGLDGSFDATSGKVSNNQTKQQTAFQQFYGYWRTRTLFTVQTPWAVFQNMAIKSLRAVQDAETNTITDFEVTFKMVRTTSTAFTAAPGVQGHLGAQAAGVTDLGTSAPTADISFAEGLASLGGGVV